MYGSRSLSDQEKRLSQLEETILVALVWAFYRFESYLLGRDEPYLSLKYHKRLVNIMNKQN